MSDLLDQLFDDNPFDDEQTQQNDTSISKIDQPQLDNTPIWSQGDSLELQTDVLDNPFASETPSSVTPFAASSIPPQPLSFSQKKTIQSVETPSSQLDAYQGNFHVFFIFRIGGIGSTT